MVLACVIERGGLDDDDDDDYDDDDDDAKNKSGAALKNCSVKCTTLINHMIRCNLWSQNGIQSQ